MHVSVKNIYKEIRGLPVLRNVSLEIPSGELVALLGPSGSGKTTLLKLIAGLGFPEEGAIFFGGEDASQKSVRDRHVGFVFQHYALFKHMTVLDNVSFGLEIRPKETRPSRSEIVQRALQLLELVQLDGLQDRYPHELSGGERQRVALARALAIDPTVLLLDEPFGALDALVRKDLRRWLRSLHDLTKHTTLFVTHDQEEALELADRVVVMNEGKIEQIGSPHEVYHSPATPFVYGFLGSTNQFVAQLTDGNITCDGSSQVIATTDQHRWNGPAHLFVRAHDFELVDPGKPGICGTVQMARRLSGVVRLEVSTPGRQGVISVEIPENNLPDGDRPAAGDALCLVPRRFGLFPKESS